MIHISYLFRLRCVGEGRKEMLVSIHFSSVWKTAPPPSPFLCTFVRFYLPFKHLGIGSINYVSYKPLTRMHNEKLLSCSVSLNMGSFNGQPWGHVFNNKLRRLFPNCYCQRESRPVLREAVHGNLYQWKKTKPY